MAVYGAIMLALVVLPVAGLVWLWTAVFLRARAAPPRCGRCGYLVAGLETMSCPECGGDFREIGIETRRRLSWTAFGLAWTLLPPLPALFVSSLCSKLLPPSVNTYSSVDATPNSGAFPTVSITLTAHHTQAGWGRTPSRPFMSWSSAPSGRGPTLAVQPLGAIAPAGVPVEPSLRTQSGATLQLPTRTRVDAASPANEIEAWLNGLAEAEASLKLNDVAPAPTALEIDARDLASLIHAMHSKGTYSSSRFQLSGGTAGGTVVPATWSIAAVIAFWVALWAAGVWLFARLRRRRSAARPSLAPSR